MLSTEKSFDSLELEVLVRKFYRSVNSGDLESVKHLMTQQSYLMTLESLGLKLAFKDASFKDALEDIEEDEGALEKVERELSKELSSDKSPPEIHIAKVEPNGSSRVTVNYTEDGKDKKLYFSKEKDGWKINYYAGRKVS